MNNSISQVAQSLRVMRTKKRLSQLQLARLAGTTNITISKIENGIVRPQKSTKAKIEHIVGIVDWERTFSEGFIHHKTNQE
ncbi:MAG: helix-turn-helix transcriptional regulator [Balneola sp.]